MADSAQEIVVATEAPPPAVGMTPMDLLSRALDRGADISMIEKLMDLQDRHERSTARKAFDAAMAEAKAQIPVIVKNRKVDYTSKDGSGQTNYRYEDLASIADVVTPILAAHGLSYRFRTSSPPNEPITVTCVISHRLGHSEENTLQGPRDESGKKNSLQAIGSTLTYLQRMTLKASLGLAAAADDDGKASSATPGDEPITEEQLNALRARIDETNADTERLCETLRVDALPELTVAGLEKANKLLNERAKIIAERAKTKAKAGAEK